MYLYFLYLHKETPKNKYTCSQITKGAGREEHWECCGNEEYKPNRKQKIKLVMENWKIMFTKKDFF